MDEARDSRASRILVWANTPGSAVTLAGFVAIAGGLLAPVLGDASLAEGGVAVLGGMAAVGLGRFLARQR